MVNGISKGKLSPSRTTNRTHVLHPPFKFTGVTWATGKLVANGYIGGQIAARDTARTPGVATHLKLESDADTLLPDGADFVRITVSIVDANGTVVPTASDSIFFSIAGS